MSNTKNTVDYLPQNNSKVITCFFAPTCSSSHGMVILKWSAWIKMSFSVSIQGLLTTTVWESLGQCLTWCHLCCFWGTCKRAQKADCCQCNLFCRSSRPTTGNSSKSANPNGFGPPHLELPWRQRLNNMVLSSHIISQRLQIWELPHEELGLCQMESSCRCYFRAEDSNFFLHSCCSVISHFSCFPACPLRVHWRHRSASISHPEGKRKLSLVSTQLPCSQLGFLEEWWPEGRMGRALFSPGALGFVENWVNFHFCFTVWMFREGFVRFGW